MRHDVPLRLQLRIQALSRGFVWGWVSRLRELRGLACVWPLNI